MYVREDLTVLQGGVGIGEGIGSGLGRGTTGHALLRCAAGHCGMETWSAGQGEGAWQGEASAGEGVRVGTGDGVRVGTGDDGDKETGRHADSDVGKGNGNLGDGHEVMGSDGACVVST